MSLWLAGKDFFSGQDVAGHKDRVTYGRSYSMSNVWVGLMRWCAKSYDGTCARELSG